MEGWQVFWIVWNMWNNVWNMFKIISKDTRTTSLDFDIESWLFRWSLNFFPVLPLARLTGTASLFEAASYPLSETIVGQLPYRFFMYFTYARHICANVSPMVDVTLCKSDPPSRTYLLLGGITCTVSGNNFDKACFGFGLFVSPPT